MFHFANPWFLLVIAAPLLVRWMGQPHHDREAFLSVPFLGELSAITGVEPTAGASVSRGSALQRLVLIVVWCSLVSALARPQLIQDPVTKTTPGRDLLIAVDLSGSMETRDFTDAAGNSTDRVSAVKEVMDEFLSRRDGDRVGLMFFGNAPFMQVPFTTDLDVSRALLDEAQARMAGPQTMLGDAIGKAITVFQNSDVKEKVLIVLADGNDSGSLVPPVKAAEIARDEGIKIHTIGMGDPTTVGEAELDVDTLKAMAQTTGGEMFLAINRQELEDVYNKIDAITTRQVETLSHRPVMDLYFWPLLAALALVLSYHAFTLCWMRFAARNDDLAQPSPAIETEHTLARTSRAG